MFIVEVFIFIVDCFALMWLWKLMRGGGIEQTPTIDLNWHNIGYTLVTSAWLLMLDRGGIPQGLLGMWRVGLMFVVCLDSIILLSGHGFRRVGSEPTLLLKLSPILTGLLNVGMIFVFILSRHITP